MITNKITVELFLNDGTKITIDKTKMKSIQSLSQSTSDASTIFYGCLPSTGSIEIIDTNGTIKGYIEDGLIDISSLEINICINNKIIRHHISTDSNYIEEDNSFQINLGDILDLWDEINFSGYYYPEHSETAYEMLSNILISYGYIQSDVDEMLSDYTLDNNLQFLSIKDYLQNINIEYPYLPSSTFREMIDKFCVLAQLNCYIDINGKPKFIDSRPISLFTNNTIIIPQKSMYNSFSKSVLLKNKYDAIEINYYDITNTINYNSVAYSYETNVDIGTSPEINVGYNRQSVSTTSPIIIVDLVSRVEGYYLSNHIQFSANSNLNLTKILNIYSYTDDENTSNKTDYNIDYDIIENNSTYAYDIDITSDVPTEDELETAFKDTVNYLDIDYYKGKYNFSLQTSSNSGKLKDLTITNDPPGFAGPTASLANATNIEINKSNDNFYIDYNILIGSFLGNYTNTQLITINNENRNIETSFTKNIGKNLNISFYGDVREISFSLVDTSSTNINEAKNPINITTNELISNKTTINGVQAVDIIKNNILSDYSNGISNGNIEIAYTDYYYENGSSAISTENGDIITIGSTAKIEGDNNLWKVTGINFEKQGFPKYSQLEVIRTLSRVFSTLEHIITNDRNILYNRVILANDSLIVASINNPNPTIYITKIGSLQWNFLSPLGFTYPNNIKYIDNKLFMLCNEGILYYSDGVNDSWINTNIESTMIDLEDIEYQNGLYVAVGSPANDSSPNIIYSNNLVSWNTLSVYGVEKNYPASLDVIAAGNGKFVAIPNDNSTHKEVYYSSDGINWNYSIIDENGVTLKDVSFGNGYFVLTTANAVFRSSDGINWEKTLDFNISNFTAPSHINFTNNRFVLYHIVSEETIGQYYIFESFDGKLWTSMKIDGVTPSYKIYYDNNSNKYFYPINVANNYGEGEISLQ